jgi:hypothetical protein
LVLVAVWPIIFAVGIAFAGDVCNQGGFVGRPIPMGLCGSNTRLDCHSQTDIGTLGALVTNSLGSYWILGASHSLAVQNAGRRGDIIVQPGGAPRPTR